MKVSSIKKPADDHLSAWQQLCANQGVLSMPGTSVRVLVYSSLHVTLIGPVL